MLYNGYWYRYRIDDTDNPMWDISIDENRKGSTWSFPAKRYSLDECYNLIKGLSNYKVEIKTN